MKRWTQRCQDGRACAWQEGGESFVPDGARYCDACLAEMMGLQEVSATGCACCELSADGVSKESALAAIRSVLENTWERPRYYSRTRVWYRHKKTKKRMESEEHGLLPFKDRYEYDTMFEGCVYDSNEPTPRTPVKVFSRGRNAMSAARDFARRLNEGKETLMEV